MGAELLKEGTVVGGRYVIDRIVGKGGMGSVYRAHHQMTGRVVALKYVSVGKEHSQKRLLQEARSMGQLNHPNVVSVLDVGDEDGAFYLTMEYLSGKSLRERISGAPALEVQEAVDLLLPVIAGVAAAHQAHIVHRDLKPENIFVCIDRDGTEYDTKVLDFGLAKMREHTHLGLTDTGMIVGTPRYMAPEQLLGEKSDPRTDVYALGLILYELLAGKNPFKGVEFQSLGLEVVEGKIPPLAALRQDLSRHLCELVHKAIDRVRDNRFASAHELGMALSAFGAARTYEAPRGAHTPQAYPSRGPTPEADSTPTLQRQTPTPALDEPTVVTGPARTDARENSTLALPASAAPASSAEQSSDAQLPVRRQSLWLIVAAAVLALTALAYWLSSLGSAGQVPPSSASNADATSAETEREAQPERKQPSADSVPNAPATTATSAKTPTEPAAPRPTTAAPTPTAAAPSNSSAPSGKSTPKKVTPRAPQPSADEVRGDSGVLRADDF